MLPNKIRKAIIAISGYCEKHDSCDKCALNYFCSEEKKGVPADWLKQEVDNGRIHRA